MWDVVVVGAGPGGSIAAKMCAEQGLKTLLLEKRRLPRDKVCSGILAGHTAQSITRDTFGGFPEGLLVPPYHLQGQIIYVEGAEPGIIDHSMPITWRKDLDYWMNQKAKEKGVEIYDAARVLDISRHEGAYIVAVQKEEKQKELSARFIIGADGATSIVRKSLFPKLKVQYHQEIRECYQGDFGLNKQYLHTFYDPILKFWFLVNHKEDVFLLEVSANLGQTKMLKDKVAKELLARDYGFDIKKEPLWRDGAIEAKLYDELISGAFLPARGNILLVGDAAGFQLPSGEGIGTALKSGALAATAIAEAIKQGKKAADIYLNEVTGIIKAIRTLYPLLVKGRYTIPENPQATVAAIRKMMVKSLEPIDSN